MYEVSLTATKTGSFSLRVRSNDGSMKSLHSLYDPEAEARVIVDTFRFGGKGILVVLGLGLGYHVKELVRRFPEAEIVVVEAMPEIYELAMRHGIISDVKGAIKFFVGHTPQDVIEGITKYQIDRGMPPLSIFTMSSAISAFPGYYRPIADKLNGAARVRLWERLRYLKFKEDRLKIGIIDFGYFLNVEVEKAIRGLGHIVTKVRGDEEETPGEILKRVAQSIVDFKPDFIISINHLGFDEEGILTSFLNSIEMPIASWYVDSPNIILKGFYKNVSPYVSIFLWDKGYIKDIKDSGFESVEHLPLAADEDTFRPLRLRQEDAKRFGVDVGFVGNSMVKPTNERLKEIPEEIHPIVERLARLLSSKRMSFDDALKTLDDSTIKKIRLFPNEDRLNMERAVLWRATLLYRLSCIEKIKEFKHIIHGDRGWQSLLNKDFNLAPELSYYRELPIFYNACKINFNATSLQMITAVNQRVFDVPACGSFLITDYQEAIDELFDVGKEVVVYKDKEEIPDLIKFYLNNPSERGRIAAKGRERVLREHTYRHRLNRMIQVMRERYS